LIIALGRNGFQVGKMPLPFTPAGAFPFEYSVSADVHETQVAPGLNVPVAIAADVEGGAAEEMTVTMVAVMAMTVMCAMAVTVATVPMAACRSRGGRGCAEGNRGDDGEGYLAKHVCSPGEV
jgi:hypothetical protein